MITLIDRESVFRVKPEAMNEKVRRESETGTIAGRSYAKGWNACLKMWHEEIEKIPLVERTRGKWLLSDEQRREDTDNDNYLYFCSNCLHSDIHAKTQEVPYCWWCGADMRGERDE